MGRFFCIFLKLIPKIFMKNLNYIGCFIVGILFFSSCITTKQIFPIGGKYSSSEKGYFLQINADSTFTYSIVFHGSLLSKCSGNWELNSKKDHIQLICQKEFELEELTATYMKERVHVFKVKNNQFIQRKLRLSKE